MTDQQPSGYRRPDDELVSAVLDGEATPEERARVEADPELSARLTEFTAVRDAVAEPVAPPSDATRERAIAAAKVAVRHHGEPSGTVRPLRRRSRSSDVPRFLAVAAAVLLVLVTFGVLANVSGDDAGDDSASDALTSADSSGGEGSDDDAAGGSAESGEDSSGAADAPDETDDLSSLDGADLGTVRSERDLETTLLERFADAEQNDEFSADTTVVPASALPQADVDAATAGASEACQVGLVEADDQLSGLLAQAQVDYDGQPAVVYVYATPEGRQRVVVVTTDGCRTVAAFDL
jgi:hypothetical protein